MTLKRFSKEYKTYGGWLNAQPRTSEYARRIIRFHERFPTLTLKELRKARLKDHALSTVSWDSLTSQQKRDRNLSFEILRSMRKGQSLIKVLEKRGLKKDFAVKHLGKYLYKSKGKWRVTASDRIESEMLIYDRDQGQISIVTTNSRDRYLLGEYFANVNKALKNNDPSVLDKYKNLKIVDAEGKEHHFETDLDKLYEIAEAQEEPEFLEIYKH